jgi:hypothetical protein
MGHEDAMRLLLDIRSARRDAIVAYSSRKSSKKKASRKKKSKSKKKDVRKLIGSLSDEQKQRMLEQLKSME